MPTAAEYNEQLMDFISCNPCNFFVVDAQARQLEQAGYVRLEEAQAWQLQPGGKYFVCRNGSALIAFRIPHEQPSGFMMFASHSDSPTLRIKPNPEMRATGDYTALNVELYGGALLNPWFDRPLSVAGRIVVKSGEGTMRTLLVNIDRDLMLIPSLAIHMNREANNGVKLNVQKDLVPLYGSSDAPDLLAIVAQEAGVDIDDILSHELVAYVRQQPRVWGAKGEYLSAPRLDDVQCAFSSLMGFLESESAAASCMPVHVVFDNEEVGSSTKQGAASTFLKDTLRRISDALGLDGEGRRRMLATSFMISGDNGHALHPNYPEKCDPTNQVSLGQSLLIKQAANQKYTTDAVSEGLCRMLAEKAGVPLCSFVNRSDVPGGSTLGNLSGNQVAVMTVDVGAPQLAMHSVYETGSAADTERLVALARQLFSSSLEQVEPGTYRFCW